MFVPVVKRLCGEGGRPSSGAIRRSPGAWIGDTETILIRNKCDLYGFFFDIFENSGKVDNVQQVHQATEPWIEATMGDSFTGLLAQASRKEFMSASFPSSNAVTFEVRGKLATTMTSI